MRPRRLATPDEVAARNLRAKGKTLREIADTFNVNLSTITGELGRPSVQNKE